MLSYDVKIGLVPIRRYLPGPKRTGMFNPDYAAANKNKAISYIKENFGDESTQFSDLEWLNEEGLLIQEDECEKAAEYFDKEKVDAIFILNCNFGNEAAAGKIAKLCGKPVLLWGPRDTAFEADGTRYTDSQCGLFAISKQLRRYNLPFSYIENCHVEDRAFAEGVKKFLSVVCMLKNFNNLKIVQVGTRVKPFKSVMYNEMELTEKFGIDVVPINMAEAAAKLNTIYTERREQLKKDAASYRKEVDTRDTADEVLERMMAFVYFYKELAEEYNTSIISTECWTSMQLAFGALPCAAMSILADMGCIVTCESDIHGAITSALLSCAARGKTPPFFGEFTCRHPENDNAELLWHCGPFALSLKKEGTKAELHIARPSFLLKDGEYTISRFQGDRGKYTLLGGSLHTVDGPHTIGTHLWAEFKDLAKTERKLIEGPYIHHMSEISGKYDDALKEFCKYVPELSYDELEEIR